MFQNWEICPLSDKARFPGEGRKLSLQHFVLGNTGKEVSTAITCVMQTARSDCERTSWNLEFNFIFTRILTSKTIYMYQAHPTGDLYDGLHFLFIYSLKLPRLQVSHG